METNILWTGREYYSLENCLVNTTPTASEITSTIIGYYDRKVYKIEYRIETNSNWETVLVEINSRHSNRVQSIKLGSDGKGSWFSDSVDVARFKGCIDIDIPLTPFTNSLPINRLNLSPGTEQIIRVIYIDLLERRITPVEQKYFRVSDTEYRYENVPNDFEAKIRVDRQGLVVDYPSLFVRTTALESNYR